MKTWVNGPRNNPMSLELCACGGYFRNYAVHAQTKVHKAEMAVQRGRLRVARGKGQV